MIAASATVGRPLRRELARVLGLLPHEGPAVLRGADDMSKYDDEDNENDNDKTILSKDSKSFRTIEDKFNGLGVGSSGRAVTIPNTVEHFIHIVNGTASEGKLLTGAYGLVQKLMSQQQQQDQSSIPSSGGGKKMLMVLCKSFGMSTQNVIGALKHFKCQPEPQSLLDVLQQGGDSSSSSSTILDGGTDPLMERHRQVSGATGVGESIVSSSSSSWRDDDHNAGYLLVTGEDSVRGLHFDSLDLVLLVGRPKTPDDYTHIAGRTGRAGKGGQVVSIVSSNQAAALYSWETMLD